MATPFIIDEWIFHDLSGGTSKFLQEQAYRFLLRLQVTDDLIVILKDSRFQDRMIEFISGSYANPITRSAAVLLEEGFIRNRDKSLLLEPDDVLVLPAFYSGINVDDQYLFQLLLRVNGSEIVTTDGGWPAQVYNRHRDRIRQRDDFVSRYIAQSL